MSLICFDIDGTLFENDSKTISKYTIEAIKRLQKNHKVVIATGRSLLSVAETGLLDMIQWDGLVLNNGQLVLNQSHQPIFVQYLNQKAFKKLYDLSQQLNHNLSIMTDDDWYVLKENDFDTYQAHEFFDEALPHVGEYKQEEIIMAMIYAPIGYDYRKYQEIEDLSVVPSVSSSADVCALGCSKFNGIKKLMDYLNLEDYIAFGDANNDIEMLKYAKIGIAMGQATEELKQVASFITKPCKENGIMYACEQMNWFQ